MDDSRLRTIAQPKDFLAATPEVIITKASSDDAPRYDFISRALRRFNYAERGKADRGIVLAYLLRASGFSRAQITRLVSRWTNNLASGACLAKRYRARRAPFARKYTAHDIDLLVQMGRANEDIRSPAIAHLFRRAHTVHGDERYVRLVDLSVSHLYNLSNSTGYQAKRASFTKTRASCNPIGVRKAPSPNG